MRNLEGSQKTLLEKLVRRQSCDILARHMNGAKSWWKNARYHIEKCRLSRAIWSDQAGDGATRNLKAGPINCMKAAKMLVQVVYPYHPHPMPRFARSCKLKQPEGRASGLFRITSNLSDTLPS